MLYDGADVPSHLRPYVAPDFSYDRWIQDKLNGVLSQQVPPAKGEPMIPRPHQKAAAVAMLKSFRAGERMFLNADGTGLGKTLSSAYGVCLMANDAGFGPRHDGKKANLLIVCPKAVIPSWRQTLKNFPLALAMFNVLIVNYQQIGKLLKEPSSAAQAKKSKTRKRATSRSGSPLDNWNFVVFDESQYLKNYPKSNVSLAAVRLASLDSDYSNVSKTPFVTFSSATPGSNPLHFAVMSAMLAPRINPTTGKNVTPKQWGGFLENEGFAVSKGKDGYSWVKPMSFDKNSSDPQKRARFQQREKEANLLREKDSRRIGKALNSASSPYIMRSPVDIAGWQEQRLIALPLELTGEQVPLYEAAWSQFCAWMKLNGIRKDPNSALVEMLRYLQKLSVLKVDSMVDFVADAVEQGNQVYISCQFLETIDKYIEKLGSRGIRVAEITGRNESEREQQRLLFQTGQAPVVISSVVEGINLQANEPFENGSKATSNERLSIIHSVRQNDVSTIQAMGRAHRSGENSLTYIPYFVSTRDEQLIQSFVSKFVNGSLMKGSESSVEKQLGEFYEMSDNGNDSAFLDPDEL